MCKIIIIYNNKRIYNSGDEFYHVTYDFTTTQNSQWLNKWGNKYGYQHCHFQKSKLGKVVKSNKSLIKCMNR